MPAFDRRLPRVTETSPIAASRSDLVAYLNGMFRSADLAQRMAGLRESVAGRIVFTTSFGLEDQVLTHSILEGKLDIEVVTLDTGRLFPQTYALWSETEQRYGRRIRALYPDRDGLEALVADQGIDGFYLSVDCRKACCGVRKVEPLRRALSGAAAWVTGLRGEQSAHRGGLGFVTADEGHGLVKANPLFDWTREATLNFAQNSNVPINSLHDQGFPSIGCAPCTRAVKPGEPERAGRWWWEDEARKECGLHVGGDGRVVRASQPEAVS